MGATRNQGSTFAVLVLASTLAVAAMVTEHVADVWIVLYVALLPVAFRILTAAGDQPARWRTFRAFGVWRAMRRGEIVVHYQPMVDAGTGRTSGAEALARWDHPRRGLLMPALWIDAAGHRWLERRFTMLVLGEAVGQAAAWRAEGRDLVVCVNVSPTSFQADWLPRAIGGLLAHYALPATYLCVEVTESALDLSDDHSQATAEALSAMGIQLALDDFGVGHSSMDRLVGLPIGKLKIDKRFVLQMVRSDRHGAVVRAGIGLGHGLGMVVVAEGVEDRETLRSLLGLGCDIAQGFYFSKALPPGELDVWMDRHERARRLGVPVDRAAALL